VGTTDLERVLRRAIRSTTVYMVSAQPSTASTGQRLAQGKGNMQDLIFIIVTIAFFAAGIGYTYAAGRL